MRQGKKGPYLKHSEDGCRKGVEVRSRSFVFKVKPKEKINSGFF